MADKKISQLTGATTPVAGTEVLPIVQSGSTKQVSIADLTAGRAVAASSITATNLKTSPATANLDISGTTVAAAGSDADIDINITPKGTGEVNITKVDVDGGAIDGASIGASSASSGAFTTLTATGDTQLNSVVLATGKQYAQTSFASLTSFVDTGIVVAMDTVSTSQMYQVDIKVNLSPGGPGNRRTVASYLVAVSAGTSVNISEILQHRISQAGIGNVTLTSHFWDGTDEETSFSSGGPWQIRLKMTGFFADPSASMQCRITRRTP
jgi:hypothetical protein